jgi:hypothetical protein
MRLFLILLALTSAACLVGCGSKSPEENETTPMATAPPPTAEENAKAIAANPNISPEVKKVIGGAGR